MAVGPPSFTSLALIGMSTSIPEGYGYFAEHPMAKDVLQLLALVFSIFLWMVQRVILEPGVLDLRVAHTGFAIATIGIGNQLNSDGIKWVGSIMTILLVVVWLFNMGMQVRAIYNKAILWPGKDEDHDELRDNKA
ncbi:hypothetical protein PMIN04_004850 [Paraphaeosphaeria minitans]